MGSMPTRRTRTRKASAGFLGATHLVGVGPEGVENLGPTGVAKIIAVSSSVEKMIPGVKTLG